MPLVSGQRLRLRAFRKWPGGGPPKCAAQVRSGSGDPACDLFGHFHLLDDHPAVGLGEAKASLPSRSKGTALDAKDLN